MSTQRDAQFRQIQQKLAGALSSEEATFLESYLAEAEDAGEAEGDAAAEEQSAEGDEPEIFEDEYGNLFAATGEMDEAGNPIVMDEAGNLIAVGADEFADEEAHAAGGDFADEDAEDYSDEDEVPIAELSNRFPAMAHEINMEEMHAMESDRDPDIVKLKMENKLLKSRIIAEEKLAESGLGDLIPLAELVGKSPAEMDVIIDGRARLVEAVGGMVKGSSAALIEATTVRESGDTGVGLRILRNSLQAR